jgi:hypothetical protein
MSLRPEFLQYLKLKMTQKNPRILVAKAIALKEAARVLREHQSKIPYEALNLPLGVSREMVYQEFLRLPTAFLQRCARILE